MIGIEATTNVFNLQALALGCATMLACIVLQAFFVRVATLNFKPRIQRLLVKGRHVAAQLAFLASALIMLCSHLLQIYVWGLSIHMTGTVPSLHEAMVFAGSTYTTVGFVDDPLPLAWQLMAIIMATSGLFSFGWSTSVMFILARTLYPSER